MKFLKKCIADGIDIDAVDDGVRNTCLHVVCNRGDLVMTKFLVQHGANVNFLNKFKQSPLHYACAAGHTHIIQFLLQNDANMSLEDEEGILPMDWVQEKFCKAVKDGNIEVAEQYLTLGYLDTNMKYSQGNTALHIACHGGVLNMVQLLVEHNVHLDSVNDFNQTPLHYASAAKHIPVIQFMIDHGANDKILDSEGHEPLYWTDRSQIKFYGCSGGHDLVAFVIPDDSYTCDRCESKIKEKELVGGCHTCNYDICLDCYKKYKALRKKVRVLIYQVLLR